MLRCISCGTDFPDHVQAQGLCPKGNGGGHILQEVIRGDFSPVTKQECDFVSVDSTDLAKWGAEAKKLFGDDQ